MKSSTSNEIDHHYGLISSLYLMKTVQTEKQLFFFIKIPHVKTLVQNSIAIFWIQFVQPKQPWRKQQLVQKTMLYLIVWESHLPLFLY